LRLTQAPIDIEVSDAMNLESLRLIEKLDLPFPWETNARGQIIMTQANYNHGNRVTRLDRLLARIAPKREAGAELGIQTDDGVKAPDLFLASVEYHVRHVDVDGYVSEAPEICIEVMSPSNGWQEMLDKMLLYFKVGAQEVWIVDIDGKLSFFASGNERLPRSRLIPEAPLSI
jgi:Uma2 family endonuclease